MKPCIHGLPPQSCVFCRIKHMSILIFALMLNACETPKPKYLDELCYEKADGTIICGQNADVEANETGDR
jgi:hypothetical protein